MPKIPSTTKRPWINSNDKPKQSGRKHNNQKFYNSAAWRGTAKAYRMTNPLCEVSKAKGLTVAAQMVDHIIRIEEDGAKFDERNLMAMSHRQHNRKSGMEKHKGILIEYVLNDEGDKIPKERKDIINLLNGGSI